MGSSVRLRTPPPWASRRSFLFFRKKKRAMPIAMSATPPTTPPAIAPTGVLFVPVVPEPLDGVPGNAVKGPSPPDGNSALPLGLSMSPFSTRK